MELGKTGDFRGKIRSSVLSMLNLRCQLDFNAEVQWGRFSPHFLYRKNNQLCQMLLLSQVRWRLRNTTVGFSNIQVTGDADQRLQVGWWGKNLTGAYIKRESEERNWKQQAYTISSKRFSIKRSRHTVAEAMWQSRKGLSKMKSTIKVKLLQVGYTFIYLLITDTVTLGNKNLIQFWRTKIVLT